MKKHWVDILLYGLSLGLLLVAIQFFQYKWLLAKSKVVWYAAIIALFFTAVGIWAGLTFNKKRQQTLPSAHDMLEPAAIVAQFGLTPREMDVLQLMALGHSNQEIADQLFVSLNTVKTHISNLLSKLNAERRTQAIQRAKTLGLLK